MKRFFLFFLGGVILFSIILWGLRFQKRIGQNNFKLFNESNIDGVINTVGIRNHGYSFGLIGNKAIYVFYPNSDNSLDGGHSFLNFAKQGDRILKKAYSDTLFLIKDAHVYKYTFIKIKY